MEQDHYYMELALEEARLAYQEDEVPIGAVIVRNGEVLARDHNRKERDQNAMHHAEVMVIQEAVRKLGTWHLEDCDLYVTLEPCLMCTGALINSRIRRIVFAARDPKGGAILSSLLLSEVRNLNHHPEIVEGICKDESSRLLKDYFKEKRKNK